MEQPFGAGPAPRTSLAPGPRIPPYLVLLRVGFTLPPALPPERCALTAPFHPYRCAEQTAGRIHRLFRVALLRGVATAVVPGKPGQHGYCGSRETLRPHPKKRRGVAEAVCFLWHWPSVRLEAHIPDVIRHTALRSSDFPPPVSALTDPGSDRPVLLPASSVPLSTLRKPLAKRSGEDSSKGSPAAI